MASIPFLSENLRDSIDLDKDEALVSLPKTGWSLSKVAMRGRPSLRAIVYGLVVLTVLLLLPVKLLLSSKRPENVSVDHRPIVEAGVGHGAEHGIGDEMIPPTDYKVVGLIFCTYPDWISITLTR